MCCYLSSLFLGKSVCVCVCVCLSGEMFETKQQFISLPDVIALACFFTFSIPYEGGRVGGCVCVCV